MVSQKQPEWQVTHPKDIYRYLKSDKLSAAVAGDDNTQIETSELLRVFGSLSQLEAAEVSTETKETNRSMSLASLMKCHA